ncbi:hypothetical protein OH76DRAFT_796456 [Lentinus brumalis]|uniref:Uncharacterized protein n=1 Tax=Lentinus brumalis TaxID=2498619 RepID=A0A371D3P7_9APHY|nr:hypothetical protein OH76DRAFT_796456 [Polyporus brumalis]
MTPHVRVDCQLPSEQSTCHPRVAAALLRECIIGLGRSDSPNYLLAYGAAKHLPFNGASSIVGEQVPVLDPGSTPHRNIEIAVSVQVFMKTDRHDRSAPESHRARARNLRRPLCPVPEIAVPSFFLLLYPHDLDLPPARPLLRGPGAPRAVQVR